MSTNLSGLGVYSKDQSGIYNLYLTNVPDTTQGYITNVTGGAFMPDISENGKILYSIYDKGAYNIALLDKIFYIEDDFVGYGEVYNSKNEFKPPIVELDTSRSRPYDDQFPNMFIMPKLMVDYGTLKPGFYFSSSEIINRLSLFLSLIHI